MKYTEKYVAHLWQVEIQTQEGLLTGSCAKHPIQLVPVLSWASQVGLERQEFSSSLVFHSLLPVSLWELAVVLLLATLPFLGHCRRVYLYVFHLQNSQGLPEQFKLLDSIVLEGKESDLTANFSFLYPSLPLGLL